MSIGSWCWLLLEKLLLFIFMKVVGGLMITVYDGDYTVCAMATSLSCRARPSELAGTSRALDVAGG